MHRWTVLRFSIYFLFVALLFQGLVWIAQSSPDGLNLFVQKAPDDEFGSSEFSIVELLQSVCLFVSIALSIWIASRNDDRRFIALVMAVLQIMMLIREQDYFLDITLGPGLWQVPVYIALIAGVYLFLRNRSAIGPSLQWMIGRPWFGLLFAALTIVMVFSRLFGQGDLWEAVMGDHFQRIVKLAAEELTELFGYLLLVYAMIEMSLDIRPEQELTNNSG